MSQVTALVLTIGEPSLSRALAALERQTSRPARLVVVKDVRSGFADAFNHGVAQVETELMLQCDADMILDEDCLSVLERCLSEDAALSLGLLDDPLLGAIEGVKLFRTQVLRRWPAPASLTPETDQLACFDAAGYATVLAARAAPAHGHAADVLGRHEPDYGDPAFVWGRYQRLGRKLRRRRGFANFQLYLDALKRSAHPSANLAIAALLCGVAAPDAPGTHTPFTTSPELEAYLAFAGARPTGPAVRKIKRRVPSAGD